MSVAVLANALVGKIRAWTSRLTPLEWTFVLTLWLPLFAYHVTMRTIRVVERGPMKEVLPWIDVYKSDVLFHLGILVAGLAVLMLSRGKRRRFGVFVALQAFLITVTSIELVSFRFFMSTGSTLDFQLIWFTLSQLSETYDVVSSEIPFYIWAMLVSSVIVAAALPWLVLFAWHKIRARRESAPLTHASPGRKGMFALMIGVVVAYSALLPPFAEQSYAFARNAFVNIALSGVDSITDAMQGDALAAKTPTTDARLVPRPDQGEKRNVVVILLESTRAQSVTLYNPDLQTTPHLVELGKKSLVADRAYAVVPHTSKALVATLCGIEPRLHIPITEATPDGIPGKCLARLLGEHGWKSGFFQTATQRFENRPTLTDNMGYETFVPLEKMSTKGFEKANYFGPEDDVMLEPSSKWIDKVKKEPFFLTYLTLTPHHNYLAPRRYGRHQFVEDDELNRYLNTLHYIDNFVNNVIELFKEKGLYEETIFVIMGDHGEGFREHGRTQHDNVIWEEGLHVPLVVHDPSRWKDGERFPYLVNQLDVLPTVVDLLGFDIEGAAFPGESLLRLDRQRTMRAHCWYERRCMASIFENEKFIYHFEQRPDQYFDLAADPFEKDDKLDELEDADKRRRDLIMWRSSVNAMYREHNRGRLAKHVFDERPTVPQSRDSTFGGWAKLIGVDAPTGPVKRGSEVKVTYYFEVIDTPPDEWKFFVHGEAKGAKMMNLDHVPVDGLYPLEDWKPGQFIADSHTFRIPGSARDEVVLWIGFWRQGDGRAKVTGATPTDGANRSKAVVIEVETPTRRPPKKKTQPKKSQPKKPQLQKTSP